MKNINLDIKNIELYADFKFVDAGFQKCSLKKRKKQSNNSKNGNSKNSPSYLAIAFLGAFV